MTEEQYAIVVDEANERAWRRPSWHAWRLRQGWQIFVRNAMP